MTFTFVTRFQYHYFFKCEIEVLPIAKMDEERN